METKGVGRFGFGALEMANARRSLSLAIIPVRGFISIFWPLPRRSRAAVSARGKAKGEVSGEKYGYVKQNKESNTIDGEVN